MLIFPFHVTFWPYVYSILSYVLFIPFLANLFFRLFSFVILVSIFLVFCLLFTEKIDFLLVKQEGFCLFLTGFEELQKKVNKYIFEIQNSKFGTLANQSMCFQGHHTILHNMTIWRIFLALFIEWLLINYEGHFLFYFIWNYFKFSFLFLDWKSGKS